MSAMVPSQIAIGRSRALTDVLQVSRIRLISANRLKSDGGQPPRGGGRFRDRSCPRTRGSRQQQRRRKRQRGQRNHQAERNRNAGMVEFAEFREIIPMPQITVPALAAMAAPTLPTDPTTASRNVFPSSSSSL
jgi:hypothetical protein